MARSKSKSAKRRVLSKRHRVSRKKSRSMSMRKKGGGCGCGAGLGNMPAASLSQSRTFFTGGQGPTPGLGELPGKHHYPLNMYNADPNYMSIAGRQTANILVKGGGKRRGNPSRKKGGSNLSGAMISGLSMATSSSVVGANSYGSGSNFFSAPYEKYTALNPPLA